MKSKLLTRITATLILTFSISLSAQEVPVQHSEIPAAAKEFLNEHFKSPFHHAIKDVESRKISYEVVLEDNTEIEFTESGKWKEVDGKRKGIPTTFIQKQTLDYIQKTYPNEAIIKFQTKQRGYEAELSNGLELLFDAQGTFTRLD
ncbi:MAG: hypothetical protein EOO45_11715 [Flavobacterium sp.]|nr:MAG: hypothetical protein EOO45_11715 [Flavobacterium sp.]